MTAEKKRRSDEYPSVYLTTEGKLISALRKYSKKTGAAGESDSKAYFSSDIGGSNEMMPVKVLECL